MPDFVIGGNIPGRAEDCRMIVIESEPVANCCTSKKRGSPFLQRCLAKKGAGPPVVIHFDGLVSVMGNWQGEFRILQIGGTGFLNLPFGEIERQAHFTGVQGSHGKACTIVDQDQITVT